jgi:hypothetical protein
MQLFKTESEIEEWWMVAWLSVHLVSFAFRIVTDVSVEFEKLNWVRVSIVVPEVEVLWNGLVCVFLDVAVVGRIEELGVYELKCGDFSRRGGDETGEGGRDSLQEIDGSFAMDINSEPRLKVKGALRDTLLSLLG